MHIFNKAEAMLQKQEAAGAHSDPDKCERSGRKADVLETWLLNSSRTNLLGLEARRNSNVLTLT